jgi:hypothetical protein
MDKKSLLSSQSLKFYLRQSQRLIKELFLNDSTVYGFWSRWYFNYNIDTFTKEDYKSSIPVNITVAQINKKNKAGEQNFT